MYDPYDGSSPAKSVEELLKLNDEDFVRCAYVSLLGREVDFEGLETYVGHVRAGADRMSLIRAIATSTEGAKRSGAQPMDLQDAMQQVDNDRPSYISRILFGAIARALKPLVARMDVCDYRLNKLEYLVKQGADGVSPFSGSRGTLSFDETLTPRARSIYLQLTKEGKGGSAKSP